MLHTASAQALLPSRPHLSRYLLGDPEVITIDEDPLGIEGDRVAVNGRIELWVKPLVDGQATGVFNRSSGTMSFSLDLAALRLAAPMMLRDLWAQRDLQAAGSFLPVPLPGHAACS